MGTWGDGLLENDTACEELGDILAEIADAVGSADDNLTPVQAGALAAQLALLARGGGPELDDPELRSVITHHRPTIVAIAPAAAAVLDAFLKVPANRDIPVACLLAAPHASEYLQPLADVWLEELEAYLGEPQGGVYLFLLDIVAPYVELSGDTLRFFTRRLEIIREEGDDDEVFHVRTYLRACKSLLASIA